MRINKSIAGFYESNQSIRKVYDFNQGWLFLKGDVPDAWNKTCDESRFDTVHLPHGVDAYEKNLSGMRNYQGMVWYRKHFDIDHSMASDHLVVYFEGIMGKSTVYLDGYKVGEHYGGYLPFHIDLNEHGIGEGHHVIAVCADNSDDKSFPPGKPQDSLDFTYLGGIYRNTYLIRRQEVHVTLPTEAETGGSVNIGTIALNDTEATVEAGLEVANCTERQLSVDILLRVEDSCGQTVGAWTLNGMIPEKGRIRLSEKLKINKPKTWHPDHPELYWLFIEIKEGKQLLDSLKVRFGIRTIALDSQKGLILNGMAYKGKLNGTNRHQDYALVGNALPDSGQYRDALLLKKAGSNVIRAAHYPLAPAFMDACDELGMFVSVANPGWQYYNLLNGKFTDRVLNDTAMMARRDKNRPSVLFWEIVLNETLAHPVKVVKKQHEIVHDEVAFTSTITAGDMNIGGKAGLDLLFTGTKETKNHCTFWREYGDGPEVDGWVSQNASTRVERAWGEKAMLDQMMNRVEYLKALVDSDKGRIGGTLWCGIDHQRGYHPDAFTGGLLDSFRNARYAYSLYQCQYAKQPEVHILNELTQISDGDIVILTNCDQVRLKFMGQERTLDVKRYEGQNGTVILPVIFKDMFDFRRIAGHHRGKTHKLKVIAEGLNGGKVVCKSEKRYAERTTGLKAYAADLAVPLVADGSDFLPVRIDVVDNKGAAKVLANERIHIEVTGEGQLIGGAATGMNPVQTEFGTATVLVRSTLKPGKIRVTAAAKGLKAVSLEIDSVQADREMIYDRAYSDRTMCADEKVIGISFDTKGIDDRDEEELIEENRRLRLRLTEKEQDLMELMSRLAIGDEQ